MSLPAQAMDQTAPSRPPRRTPAGDAAWGWLIGILAGLLGLGPWLVTGAQLPLQNLWGADVAPDQMPVSLLPLSQYELTTIVALLTVGGAAAGLAVRIWSPARRRLVAWCAAAGVLVVQSTAAVQSFTVLDGGLTGGTTASLYFAGLLAGVTASLAAALVAHLLLCSRSRSLAALGAGLVAVPFASWTVEWVVGFVGHINVPVGSAVTGSLDSRHPRWLCPGMVRPSSCAAGRGVGPEPCPVVGGSRPVHLRQLRSGDARTGWRPAGDAVDESADPGGNTWTRGWSSSQSLAGSGHRVGGAGGQIHCRPPAAGRADLPVHVKSGLTRD